MIIIVNTTEEYYIRIKDCDFFGKELMCDDGFIHASTQEQFPLIIPKLNKKGTNFMVLFIDTNKLNATLKWEHSKSLNHDFPHIYGEINKNAVIKAVKLSEYTFC